MDLLILGGTHFAGRHLVEAALARGHRLTLFTRGRTNPTLFPEVEHLHGDRTQPGALAPLSGRRWDAVIDMCGYHPRDVAASAQALQGAADTYVFVSTISVYADFARPGIDEGYPVARLPDPAHAVVSNATYGPLKAACEAAVTAVFGPRALILRPGLIVGPHDPTGRFTYWPLRLARGGEVLAPETPTCPVQFVDARDLAGWTLSCLAQGLYGLFNVTGPAAPLTLGDLLAACAGAAGVASTITWVAPEFLQTHAVAPFTDLPLWAPPGNPGLLTIDCRRALAAGLHFRPLATTIQDTLAWAQTQPPQPEPTAGLSPAREAALLAAWHARDLPAAVQRQSGD